jgi:hypothetical protein
MNETITRGEKLPVKVNAERDRKMRRVGRRKE